MLTAFWETLPQLTEQFLYLLGPLHTMPNHCILHQDTWCFLVAWTYSLAESIFSFLPVHWHLDSSSHGCRSLKLKMSTSACNLQCSMDKKMSLSYTWLKLKNNWLVTTGRYKTQFIAFQAKVEKVQFLWKKIPEPSITWQMKANPSLSGHEPSYVLKHVGDTQSKNTVLH